MNEHVDIVRVGFTGTHVGMTHAQMYAFRDLLATLHSDGAEFHHGDCIGSDETAAGYARKGGFYVVMHPPVDPSRRAFTAADETRRAMPYLARNREIVDETDQLVATPKGLEYTRSGTWSTVRYARKAGKQVTIVWPDGRVEVES